MLQHIAGLGSACRLTRGKYIFLNTLHKNKNRWTQNNLNNTKNVKIKALS